MGDFEGLKEGGFTKEVYGKVLFTAVYTQLSMGNPCPNFLEGVLKRVLELKQVGDF